MSFLLHPILKPYPGYRELKDDDKKEFREKILMGGGDIKDVRVAETVQMCVMYFKRIMGLIQAKEIKEGEATVCQRGDCSSGSSLSLKPPTTSDSWRRSIHVLILACPLLWVDPQLTIVHQELCITIRPQQVGFLDSE